MPLPRILPAAEADILEVRARTLAEFGASQLAEYDALLENALEALAENPRSGRPRPDIAPAAWVYRMDLRKRGIPHLLLYRILDDERAEVRALFHAAMHLKSRWLQRGSK